MYKYIFINLLFTLIFTGCGYKADPIYVDDSQKVQVVK